MKSMTRGVVAGAPANQAKKAWGPPPASAERIA